MKTYIRLQYEKIRTLRAYRDGNWKNIPIKENGQSLVRASSIYAYPYYCKEMSLSGDDGIYLREEVYNRFLQARKTAISHGYDLMIYDGWRSKELQESLFRHYLKEFVVPKYSNLISLFASARAPQEIKKVFLTLSENIQVTMKHENMTFVSWPSDDIEQPSPHATGGAIDVWLYKDGQPVSLGVPFDWMEEAAGAFYHLKFKRLKFRGDRSVCLHRNIILYSMIKSGFSCYGPEIWHFNFGNQMDALVKRKHAVYSYIEP